MMLPPIGFNGSLENMPPSGLAVTWLVMTTATPYLWGGDAEEDRGGLWGEGGWESRENEQ
jgi:hypothetical protein